MEFVEVEEFAEFARGQQPEMLRYATVLCGSRHQAEDVVQEVLAKAVRHWPRIRQADVPAAYLHRMVTNEFLSLRRGWVRVQPVAEVPMVQKMRDHAEATVEALLLVEQLARLPKRQRTVLALRYYGGLSDPEIAQELGCSAGTVRGHASRALATLRIDVISTNRLLEA